jgi:hypothetical protein
LKEKGFVLSKLVVNIKDKDFVEIILEKEVADEIRELAADEVGLHFDSNYNPTEEGLILESLIDRFYC